jgi:hypothetical protein
MTVISDNFNRANEVPLASPWAITGTSDGSFSLVSNAIVWDVNSVDTEARYTSSGISGDQYSQVKDHGGNGWGIRIWPWCHMPTSQRHQNVHPCHLQHRGGQHRSPDLERRHIDARW